MKDIFRDTTQQKENVFYTLLLEGKNNTGRESLCSPSRAALYLYSNRAVRRSERFCGKYPKYKRPFSACYADRRDKTDAAALCLENAKYTIRIIHVQKYLMALQKCTLSGTAGG